MSYIRKLLLDHAFECVNDAGEFEPPDEILSSVVMHLASHDPLFVGDAINGDSRFQMELAAAAAGAGQGSLAIAVARGLLYDAALRACQPFERDVMAYIKRPEPDHND